MVAFCLIIQGTRGICKDQYNDVALLELVGTPAGVGLPLRLPFFGVLHQFLKGGMVVCFGSREEKSHAVVSGASTRL